MPPPPPPTTQTAATDIGFSVVFPSFNQKDIVRKTLAGLCNLENKTGYKLEVILVDNNSKDNGPAEIHQAYWDKLDLTVVQRRKLDNTFAVPSARNMGLRLAKYDWIINLDNDIILPPNYCDTAVEYIQSLNGDDNIFVTAERIFVTTQMYSDADILRQGPSLYSKFPVVRSRANYFLERDNRVTPGNMHENIANNNHPYAFFYACNTLYRRDVALSFGGYDTDYEGHWGYDDIKFSYDMLTKGKARPVVNDDLKVYHQEPEGENWVPAGTKLKDGQAPNPRLNKKDNPNWQRIAKDIPGYVDWKTEYYRKLSKDITL